VYVLPCNIWTGMWSLHMSGEEFYEDQLSTAVKSINIVDTRMLHAEKFVVDDSGLSLSMCRLSRLLG
jgi:hypothetical protein